MKELERSLPKIGATPEQKKALEVMCDAMVNKLLHAPTTALKGDGGGAELIAAVRALFALPEEAGGSITTATTTTSTPTSTSTSASTSTSTSEGER